MAGFDTSFSDITGALSGVLGSSTAQSGTQSTSIDQQGMMYLLNSILGSTQGLASITGMQKGAGIYSSAINGLLVNDLLARAAGEVAARNTTTKTKQKNSSGGILGSIFGSDSPIGSSIGGLVSSIF